MFLDIYILPLYCYILSESILLQKPPSVSLRMFSCDKPCKCFYLIACRHAEINYAVVAVNKFYLNCRRQENEKLNSRMTPVHLIIRA